MAGTRRFILFELNEVPLRVVRHFADRHANSAFARVLKQGRHWTNFLHSGTELCMEPLLTQNSIRLMSVDGSCHLNVQAIRIPESDGHVRQQCGAARGKWILTSNFLARAALVR